MTSFKKNTRKKGTKGETFVCTQLSQKGLKIVDRNVQEKFAEIDIVALDGETLCFIEVRTRESTILGHPAETITPKKQRVIRRAAEAYLAKKKIPPCPVRFDVATIVWESMTYEYFENAF